MKHIHLYVTEEIYEILRKKAFETRKSRSQIVSDYITNDNGGRKHEVKIELTQRKPTKIPNPNSIPSLYAHKRGELNPDDYV